MNAQILQPDVESFLRMGNLRAWCTTSMVSMIAMQSDPSRNSKQRNIETF